MLLLAVTAITQAQRKAGTPQSRNATSRTQRKLVETVKTQDGREVRLYDDMTYEVGGSQPRPKSGTIEVRVKAGVITGGGDVKAVARTDFIVFGEDIKPLLPAVNDRSGKPMDIFTFYLADRFRSLDEGAAYTGALEKLRPITLGTLTTDFEGNGTIQVPRSDKPYYLYGFFKVGNSACMWYFEFTPDKNVNLILDNNNSAICG